MLKKHAYREKRTKLVTQNSNEAEMKETLENIGLTLFAMHLIKEHSVQHLLFVLEVSKLKAQCLRHGFIKKQDIGKYLEVRDILKRIDSEVFDAESFFRNAKHIMCNYVDWEGDYAVNISSATRAKVLTAFEKLCERREKVIQETAAEVALSSGATPPTPPTANNMMTNRPSTNGRGMNAEQQQKHDLDRDKWSINAMMAVVDAGMQDVWHLLENDSFARFRCSKQFHDHQMNCNANNTSNMPW